MNTDIQTCIHRILSGLLCLLLLSGSSGLSRADLYRTITFPDGDTINSLNDPKRPFYFQLTENGVHYTIATKHDMVGNPVGSQNVKAPTLSTEHCHSAPASLHIFMGPQTSGHTPGEKVLINVCDGNKDAFAIGNNATSAIKFWVYLPGNFQAPLGDCQMTEWWNNNAVADLVLGPGNTWNMGVYTQKSTHRIKYEGGTLTIGAWHKFIVQLTTSYDDTKGAVSVWCDDKQVINQQNIQVGLVSRRKNYVEAGLYRGAQKVTTEAWIDDIMYGDSYNDVVADPPAPTAH